MINEKIRTRASEDCFFIKILQLKSARTFSVIEEPAASLIRMDVRCCFKQTNKLRWRDYARASKKGRHGAGSLHRPIGERAGLRFFKGKRAARILSRLGPGHQRF